MHKNILKALIMFVQKLKVRNFKNIGGKWIEFNFSSNSLWLISGQNGSGKTTILSALTFGLFGKNSDTKGDSKSSLSTSELINDINKKELEVHIELSNGYSIKRGLKPNFLEIYDKDGNNIADKSSKVIDQQFLETEILGGIEYGMFHKLTYISAKSISVPFINMSNSQRKEFLENLLDLRLIHYVNESIKTNVSELKLDLRTVENEVRLYDDSVKNELNNIANLEAKRQSQIKQLEEMKKNKESLIIEAKNRIECNIGDIIELEQKQSYLESDIKNIQDDIIRYDKIHYEKDDKEFEKKLKTSSINDKQTEMLRRKSEKDVYENNLEGFKECGTCPTIKLVVGIFDYDDYNRFIEDGKKFILEAKSDIEKIDNELEYYKSIQVKIDKLKYDLAECKNELYTVINDSNSLKNDIKKDEKFINDIENQLDSLTPIEIDDSSLISLENKLKLSNIKHDNIVNKLEQHDRIKKRISDKSLYKSIMSRYVPIFQAKVNELINNFMEDDPFTLQVELEDDFNMLFKKNGKKISVFSLSEGQKSSINFAFLFGFQYLISLKNESSNLNMLFVDEILDIALDSTRLNKIVNYIKDISKNKMIMLISHNSDLPLEVFDKTITVNKKYNFSNYIIE